MLSHSNNHNHNSDNHHSSDMLVDYSFISNSFNNIKHADVIFYIENLKFYGIQKIQAIRSAFFDKLFYEDEQTEEEGLVSRARINKLMNKCYAINVDNVVYKFSMPEHAFVA
jgi:hypothetical protein